MGLNPRARETPTELNFEPNIKGVGILYLLISDHTCIFYYWIFLFFIFSLLIKFMEEFEL